MDHVEVVVVEFEFEKEEGEEVDWKSVSEVVVAEGSAGGYIQKKVVQKVVHS